MADFKTHLTTSSFMGVAYGVAARALFDVPLSTCALAGGLCAVSGMLPDVDSGSSKPLRESLAFAAAVVPMMMVDRLQPLGADTELIVLAGALVYLNDEEVGKSPVTTDFTWYGDYDLIARLDGHQTLSTHFVVKRPWYQVPPLDFFAEVLWPGHVVDRHHRRFELAPTQPTDRAELVDRAQAFQQRALSESF